MAQEWSGSVLPTDDEWVLCPSIEKRRMMSRSDEEIEQEMDDVVSWRKGWPTLRRLPLATDPILYQSLGPKLPNSEQINIILQAQNLKGGFFEIVHRYRYHAEPVDEDITLLVHAPYVSELHHAVLALRKYMKGEGLDWIIEVMDSRIADQTPMYPICISRQPTEVHHWNKIEPNLLKLLEGQTWSAIDVLLIGPEWDPSKCRPTVQILTPAADEEAWTFFRHKNNLLTKIRKLISPTFDVVVIHGSIRPAVFSWNARPYLDLNLDEDYRNITPGASVGTGTEKEGGGTLGGCLLLKEKDTNVIRKFGVTNHHVIANPLVTKANGSKSIKPNHPLVLENQIEIVSPANADHASKISSLKAVIGHNEFLLNGHPAKMMGLREKAKFDSSVRPRLESLEKEISTMEEMIPRFELEDRRVGYLFASSGERETEDPKPMALDWALVRLTTPQKLDNVTSRFSRETHPTRGHRSRVPYDDQEIKYWSHVPQNVSVPVMKCGRTSNWTFGETNGINSLLSSERGPHWALSIVSPREEGYPYKPPFLTAGDSGSMVLLNDANTKKRGGRVWLGLAYATMSDPVLVIPQQTLSYAMPFGVMAQDIEKITGLTVESPTFLSLE